ncbi:hypothetical protein CK203_105429 [Vitis vinifera]|uniref:Uncharacterized protein n=1 Tax=Vitis vinifera TaxID=29760 RepID=A0A438F7X0_VITVI|nr:hypothetical protein CK203_105429 [Vitis vinifera]
MSADLYTDSEESGCETEEQTDDDDDDDDDMRSWKMMDMMM